MRAIAEFIMRGRMQATLVVAAAAALPLLFWLSAAASALVLLRRGMQDAVTIVVWAVLPALAWWYFAEPRTLLVLLGTLSLAQLLRRTQSWVAVLLASVPLGLLFALVLGEQFQESIARLAQELNTLMQQQMGEILQQWPEAERARMDSLVVPVLTGLMAALLQLLSLLSLMLARYWQAALYNPGGFAGEFHALRLSPLPALACCWRCCWCPMWHRSWPCWCRCVQCRWPWLVWHCCMAWWRRSVWPGSGWLACMCRCCCSCS